MWTNISLEIEAVEAPVASNAHHDSIVLGLDFKDKGMANEMFKA